MKKREGLLEELTPENGEDVCVYVCVCVCVCKCCWRVVRGRGWRDVCVCGGVSIYTHHN